MVKSGDGGNGLERSGFVLALIIYMVVMLIVHLHNGRHGLKFCSSTSIISTETPIMREMVCKHEIFFPYDLKVQTMPE